MTEAEAPTQKVLAKLSDYWKQLKRNAGLRSGSVMPGIKG
jgi:hypothetical protein